MEELESRLDASNFIDAPYFYEKEFYNLLLNIYSCYEYMKSDGAKVPDNDENKIRDILYSYISETHIRNNICNIYGFNIDKEVDEKSGRVDLKIKRLDDFEDYSAYYIIECKRLDGCSKLNREYTKNGVQRFTTGYYSSHYGISGMLAFIVKPISIDQNMQKIGTFCVIEEAKLYSSAHNSLKLYHLMMDFSNNIAV